MIDHDSFKDELKRKEEEIASLQKTKKDLESAYEELQKLKLVNADMNKNIVLLESKDKELDDVKLQLECKEGELYEIKTLLNSPSVEYIRSIVLEPKNRIPGEFHKLSFLKILKTL